MGDVRFKLLVLKTRQVDKLRAFYHILGVEFAAERHGDGPLHYAGRVGETVLEIYPLAEEVAPDAAIRLGFAVADLDAVVQSVRGMEVQVLHPPRDSAWGRRAVVRDPDGRAVELYQ